MPCYRCSMCNYDFPQMKAYEVCPRCEEPTSPVSNIKSMPKAEAKSLKANFDFNRFYLEHDKTADPKRVLAISPPINPKHKKLLGLKCTAI